MAKKWILPKLMQVVHKKPGYNLEWPNYTVAPVLVQLYTSTCPIYQTLLFDFLRVWFRDSCDT